MAFHIELFMNLSLFQSIVNDGFRFKRRGWIYQTTGISDLSVQYNVQYDHEQPMYLRHQKENVINTLKVEKRLINIVLSSSRKNIVTGFSLQGFLMLYDSTKLHMSRSLAYISSLWVIYGVHKIKQWIKYVIFYCFHLVCNEC